MENRVKRPTYVIGLIINIICFLFLSISAGLFLFIFLDIQMGAEEGSNVNLLDFQLLFGGIMLFAVLGILFSIIALFKSSLPYATFNKQKIWPILSVVVSVIVAGFGIQSTATTSGSIVTEICFIVALVIADLLIIFGIVANKKALKKQIEE